MGEAFYGNGLRFECTRCSNCCRIDPGYVFLSYHDLSRLLQTTGMERGGFLKTYCRAVYINGVYRLSLKEKSNYDCIFWSRGACSVYEGRPLQCRSFPFWSEYLTDQKKWDALEQSCPGVNRGQVHSREEIEEWKNQRDNEPLIVVSPEELMNIDKEPV